MEQKAYKSKFETMVDEMKLKGFNFAKCVSLFERRFNEGTQKFEDKTFSSVDELKSEYEARYPGAEIEIVTADDGKSSYLFVKAK